MEYSSAFVFSNHKWLLPASMCGVVSSSAAPALLLSWQVGALVYLSDSNEPNEPFKELIVYVPCWQGILGSTVTFVFFNLLGVI